jgi:hypothetical protein
MSHITKVYSPTKESNEQLAKKVKFYPSLFNLYNKTELNIQPIKGQFIGISSCMESSVPSVSSIYPDNPIIIIHCPHLCHKNSASLAV